MYKASGMLQNLVVSKTLDNVGSSRHFGQQQGQNIPADKEAPFSYPPRLFGVQKLGKTRQKLSKPFRCKYIPSMRAFKGGWRETLCETENASRRTIPRWALFAKSPITFPITGWQGLGGGIQNNWRPLGRLLCAMHPYILEFGSI